MKIIVFGASGGTGLEVLKGAIRQGHEVTAFVRNADKITEQHERLTIRCGDATDREAVSAAIEGHEAVISCLGTRGFGKSNALTTMTAELLHGMKEHNVQRIVYLASAGIHDEIPGVIGKLTGMLLRNVLADHRQAVGQITASGLEWTIVRPLQLVNGPLTAKYRTSLLGVPSKGSRIARADVAHFLLIALLEPQFIEASVGLAY